MPSSEDKPFLPQDGSCEFFCNSFLLRLLYVYGFQEWPLQKSHVSDPLASWSNTD